MTQPFDAIRAEEGRIRAAYGRRREGDRYSWFQPGQLFIVQQRERRVLAVLKRSGCTDLESKSILEIGCGRG